MCEKTKYKTCNTRIDKCMKNRILFYNQLGFNMLGCCCGHGKYQMTIIVKNNLGIISELFSDKIIPRKRKFYKRDKEGYYYIPETIDGDPNLKGA